MSVIKPPIGIVPRWIWLGRRQNELAEAVQRYHDAGLGDRVCVSEWIQEIQQIEKELAAMGKTDKLYEHSMGRHDRP